MSVGLLADRVFVVDLDWWPLEGELKRCSEPQCVFRAVASGFSFGPVSRRRSSACERHLPPRVIAGRRVLRLVPSVSTDASRQYVTSHPEAASAISPAITSRMAIVAAQLFTCDRDGTQVVVPTGQAAPAGWTSVTSGQYTPQTASVLLCPACTGVVVNAAELPKPPPAAVTSAPASG